MTPLHYKLDSGIYIISMLCNVISMFAHLFSATYYFTPFITLQFISSFLLLPTG